MEFLFINVKIKVRKSKRTFLESKEIKAWKDVTFRKGQEHLERDRDMFLFQVYTGYYYKDLFIFTKEQLVEDEQYGYMVVGPRERTETKRSSHYLKFPMMQR